NGAHVAPVAVKAVGPELLARGEHVGDDVLAEVLGGVRVVLIGYQVGAQLLPVEDVYAHAGQVALGLLWLLLELVDVPVLAAGEDAEASRLLQGDLLDGYRAVGVVLDVLAEHVG